MRLAAKTNRCKLANKCWKCAERMITVEITMIPISFVMVPITFLMVPITFVMVPVTLWLVSTSLSSKQSPVASCLSSVLSNIEHFCCNSNPVEVSGELLGDVGFAAGGQPHHHNHLTDPAHGAPATGSRRWAKHCNQSCHQNKTACSYGQAQYCLL